MFQVVVLHTLCNTIIIAYSYSHYISTLVPCWNIYNYL